MESRETSSWSSSDLVNVVELYALGLRLLSKTHDSSLSNLSPVIQSLTLLNQLVQQTQSIATPLHLHPTHETPPSSPLQGRQLVAIDREEHSVPIDRHCDVVSCPQRCSSLVHQLASP
eukprot:764615-Hanusia_phi.AAC.2